jgi:uncharacterized protein YndB with AHSA1/START domain
VIATRERTVRAAPEAVWALVGDAHALPRWWPRTERVENVHEDAWTTVMRSDRGRVVRADWRLEVSEPPSRRAWSQAIEGTPFERVISERRVEVRVAPAGDGTAVTLELRQRSRKLGRVGDLILRRPAARELDVALAQLAEALGG